VKQLKIVVALVGLIGTLWFGSTRAQADDERLALMGYDTVAYFTEGRPMKGDPRFQLEWDGAVYRFASAKHLEMFKADPDKYLPQYDNWCAASVAKGVKVRGNPEYWSVVDGRLYLFGGPAGPSLMAADAAAMKQAADAAWPTVSLLPDPPKRN
jgi:YHS domain-containing protein